ncbi:hypothetical protein SHJG_1730 [Streptomyces hygroscopicus subsp. jinggangensis 5008]|nr:hypothetical protein SHJG_1730 [Streptomyces hygroscopicus subsp. jinggangensis 5008]AGF61161.1 hypothetical protein SHJGH_1495 [Streptomyces hygroscopicus subsp. jinggangensis TL01]
MLCTLAGDHYDEESSFRLAFWAVLGAGAVCVALCVRHTRIRIREYEHGFELRRPGRRTLRYTWQEIASVGSTRVSVHFNLAHSHDVLKTVIRPYAGGRIRVRGLDYVKVREESGFWRMFSRATPDTGERFVKTATQAVAAALAQRHLDELVAGGAFHWGALTFTDEGLTLAPFPGAVPWSRITLVSAGPGIGVRLDVRGLAEHIGHGALSARATKAGYRTQGDRLEVFMPAHRPGSDYAALGILLAGGSALHGERHGGRER